MKMKSVSRRYFSLGVLVAGVAAPAILTSRANAAEFTGKLVTEIPSAHPFVVRLRETSAKILEETGGRFDLKIFPDGQLGGGGDLLSQVRSGSVEFYGVGGLQFGGLVPVAQIGSTGFAFKDYDAVWAAMDGDLGKLIHKAISDTPSLMAFETVWDVGFRQITSRVRRINDPKDLQNFKVRVAGSALRTSLFKALGASPTTLTFAEVYTALQSGAVDGQENTLSNVTAGKLYEVQKYCAMTNHMWAGNHIVGNKAFWATVPKDLQRIVTSNINASALLERADIVQFELASKKTMIDAGVVFNEPDREPFHKALVSLGFYEEWRKKLGDEAWNVLQKYSGPLS
jgi:tripartite ATP-independent transporter DctP family solute receptor